MREKWIRKPVDWFEKVEWRQFWGREGQWWLEKRFYFQNGQLPEHYTDEIAECLSDPALMDGGVLTVSRVEVMPQPAGSYFNWGMDERGKWCKGASTLSDTIAICDCGFNTVDLFVLKAGNIVARYTNGETLGMRRAAELITDHIRKFHGVSLSLHEADAFLHQKQPELSTSNGLIDLTSLVNQARETVAAGVLQFTERQWGNARRFRHVLFTGGGSEILRDQLARAYPHGYVLSGAVTANAAGLAKYGQQPLSK